MTISACMNGHIPSLDRLWGRAYPKYICPVVRFDRRALLLIIIMIIILILILLIIIIITIMIPTAPRIPPHRPPRTDKGRGVMSLVGDVLS